MRRHAQAQFLGALGEADAALDEWRKNSLATHAAADPLQLVRSQQEHALNIAVAVEDDQCHCLLGNLRMKERSVVLVDDDAARGQPVCLAVDIHQRQRQPGVGAHYAERAIGG
jgi:hypothetical protein